MAKEQRDKRTIVAACVKQAYGRSLGLFSEIAESRHGSAVAEQAQAILDGEPVSEQNSNAVRIISELAAEFDEAVAMEIVEQAQRVLTAIEEAASGETDDAYRDPVEASTPEADKRAIASINIKQTTTDIFNGTILVEVDKLLKANGLGVSRQNRQSLMARSQEELMEFYLWNPGSLNPGSLNPDSISPGY